MMTYGDGVCTVDLNALVKFHQEHGKTATMTTVNIAQMKGVLDISDDNAVRSFREKDEKDASLINGGFMVLNPDIFSYLEDDTTVFEKEPLQRLAAEGQLMSFHHTGSGSAWIRSVRCRNWRPYGRQARHPGKSGKTDTGEWNSYDRMDKGNVAGILHIL